MMGGGMLEFWNQMGFLAKGIAILMMLMSIYSVGVFIERMIVYRAAKKQSIDYLPLAAKAMQDGNYSAAVEASRRYSKSHLAKVLAAGLMQYQFEREDTPGHDAVESVHQGKAQLAFLLRPPKVEWLEKIGQSKETMPQKSTYFYPKMASGMVFYNHQSK